jgi:hypothetical protein
MKADTTVTISPTSVKEWEDKALELEREASKKLEEAKLLRSRADAAKLLLGPIVAPPEEGDFREDPGSMIEAMATIANRSDRPLARATMKNRLLTLGFPDARMGNYFYTCVARLKSKNRITVTPDGKIWKAP